MCFLRHLKIIKIYCYISCMLFLFVPYSALLLIYEFCEFYLLMGPLKIISFIFKIFMYVCFVKHKNDFICVETTKMSAEVLMLART